MAFLLVALVPMAILFFSISLHTREHELDEVRQTLERVADVQQRRLDLEFHRLDDLMSLVASRTQLRISLRAFNRSAAPRSLELVKRILRDALAPVPNLEGIWVRNPAGQLVASVANRVQGDKTPPAFQPSSEPIKIVWPPEGEAQLWLNGPLEIDGEFIGSLHILARTKDLLAVLEDFAHAEVGGKTLLLVAESGHRLRPLRSSLTGDKTVPEFLKALLPAENPGKGQNLRHPLQIGGNLFEVRPLAYGLGQVLVYCSLDDVSNVLWEQTSFLLPVTMLALLLCLLMALTFTRMISRPVQVLTEANRALHEGHPGQPINEDFWGEFTELTRSFNQATGVLAHRTSELNREIERRRRSQQELVDLANTDALTGLINRRHFMDLLKRQLRQPDHLRQHGALLLYLDLDGFKPINDRLGHEAGDQVLQVIGDRLKNLVRDRDFAARLGGDEFALLLIEDEGNPLDPEQVVKRAEEHLSRPIRVGNQLVQVGCSGGVARLAPGDTHQEVLNRADRAMYRVKAARRDRPPIPG
jgi:diguanylate cyclase (GGDEF)-like protein